MAKNTRHSEHFDKLSAPLVSETQNIEAPYELPEGWKWTRLGDVADFIGGGTPDKSNHDYWNGIIPWASVKDIKGKFLFSTEDTITEIGLKESATNLCEKEGLILVTRIAPGKAIISKIQTAINQDLKIIQTKENKLLLKYFFDFYEDEIKNLSSGTTVKGIKLDVLEQIPFPLPPLTEQQRIVNRIETMFAKLDQAQEKAQTVLDSFETRKAAILHKAFTGQLRIDNEELAIADWEDTTIGECIKLFSGQDFKPEDYNAEENGIPYITGASNFAENHVLINRWTSKPSVIAKKDDVLLVCKGSGYGKTIIADFEEAHIARQIMALRIPKNISNRFILYFLQNNYEYLRNGGQGLIPGIARNIVLQMPIKLPPLNYQLSIVNCLDTVLEKESRAKEAAQTVLEQIVLLKKSILARAFRGEL